MTRTSTHPPHLRPVESFVEAPEAFEASGQDPMRDLEDRAAQGDVSAWAELYALHYASVFRQLRYMCGDRAMAEELAQETFAQAMACHERYDGRRAFAGWLHGIAVNVVRKHWRKQRNRSRAMEKLQHLTVVGSRGGDDPDGNHLRSERSRVLYAVLEEIPARWREAFVLRELQGLSTGEAAERLGITPQNVAVRVTRARSRIRDELQRRGWLGEVETGQEARAR